MADVQYSVARDDERGTSYELLLYDISTASAATVQVNTEHTDNGRFPVRQHGPRRLWDEVEAAHTWWIEHGRPIRTRYGLTLTRDSQTAWLDHPSNTVAVIVAGTWSKNVPH